MPYFAATTNGDTIRIELCEYDHSPWLSIFLDDEWKMDIPAASVETLVNLLRQARKGK